MSPRSKTRGSAGLVDTHMELAGPLGRLDVVFRSRLRARQRRQIMIAFLRQMRPFLQYFRYATLRHSGSGDWYHFRAEDQGIPLFPASPWTSPAGELGYRIRMKRLKKGWSQEKLGRRAGIAWRHLSRLERGLCRPREHTLRRLESVLGISLIPFAPGKVEKEEIGKRVVLGQEFLPEPVRHQELKAV